MAQKTQTRRRAQSAVHDELSFESGAELGPSAECSLVCGVTPRGRIDLRATLPAAGSPALPAAVAQRMLDAFSQGRGPGVLHLGVAELDTELDPTLAYWRDIGRTVVSRACGAHDPTDPQSLVIPDAVPEELEAYVQSVPPMEGAELVTPGLLAELWSDIAHALTEQAATDVDGLQGYLKKQSPVWHVVGRVCLHLAENKKDQQYPFAFLATYVHRLSRQARAQHVPLGRALREYAGAKNRQQLLSLLSPLSRAAEGSGFLRELVDSGDIYHPLCWSPAEAHQFLCDIPLYERAGLVVRIPDWWKGSSRPRPKVAVTVGGKAPSRLGMDTLLDFDVQLTLDGETLTPEEISHLLSASEGLVLLKGRWVEVDQEKLSKVLEQWRDAQRQAFEGGVSFGEAMRLLAGTPLDGAAGRSGDDRPEWSQVVAGKWLAARLEALRSPELQSDIDANAGLQAELRPYQKVGVQWLSSLRALELGGCLADDMGLGKTIQVLGLLSTSRKQREKGTDLLVVPASLLDNWRQEMERFAPQLRLLIAHPSRIPSSRLKELPAEQVEQHHAVITTYGTLDAPRLDERLPLAQRGARRGAGDQESRISADEGGQERSGPAARLALTGTPVENRLGDLWSIFDFLNPGLLGVGARVQ